MIKKEPEFISLKEAAQLSGYSSDYIGQLIRSGKLPGKQVFLNVAWMTTREAIAEYLKKDNKSDDASKTRWDRFYETLMSVETLQNLYLGLVWLVMGIFGVFVIFLLYVFAVSIDHRIEMRHLEKVQHDL